MPRRIQRQRTKGWRMPEGAVYVGRPTKWGNPFRAYKCSCCGWWDVIDDNGVTYLIDHTYVRLPGVMSDPRWRTSQREAQRSAVGLYVNELTYWFGGRLDYEPGLADALRDLRGRDLACWCPLDDGHGNRVPCHADVLLELANDATELDAEHQKENL